MFLHANGSSDSMQSTFLEMTANELRIVLAQRDATIYFTKTHIADLRTVIQADTSDQFETNTGADRQRDVPSESSAG
jgi:hypothetical protein